MILYQFRLVLYDLTFDRVDPTGFTFKPFETFGDILYWFDDDSRIAFCAAGFVGFNASSFKLPNGFKSLNIGLSPYGDVANDNIC